MMKFVDLGISHKIIEKKFYKNIDYILKHKKFILGPEVEELEKNLSKFVKSKAICVGSGTDAILLALMSINIKPGDEVITTPFTWASNSEMIKLLGAKPVYIDIDENNFNLNPNLINSKITKKTKAILTVNIFGQCCDYAKIRKLINKRKIFIIEDAAQSFGAKYKNNYSCSLGDISCTSFFPSKPLGGYGDGGACFTNNKKIYKKIMMLRNHGQIYRNNHSILGLNSRMDSIQAMVINLKLKNLNKELFLRKKVAKNYYSLLKNKKEIIKLPKIEKYNDSVFAQYTIQVKNRNKILKKFKNKKIPFSIFYPKPLYKQKAFYVKNFNLSIVEKIVNQVISVPFHPYLTLNDQLKVSKCFE